MMYLKKLAQKSTSYILRRTKESRVGRTTRKESRKTLPQAVDKPKPHENGLLREPSLTQNNNIGCTSNEALLGVLGITGQII